jgi:hypothetical protein
MMFRKIADSIEYNQTRRALLKGMAALPLVLTVGRPELVIASEEWLKSAETLTPVDEILDPVWEETTMDNRAKPFAFTNGMRASHVPRERFPLVPHGMALLGAGGRILHRTRFAHPFTMTEFDTLKCLWHLVPGPAGRARGLW